MSEAGEELALLAGAFAPDASLSVPTLRLRERLDARLAAEMSLAPPESAAAGASRRFSEWFAALFAPFALLTPPRLAAFASVAAALAFGAIFVGLYGLQPAPPTIVVERAPAVAPVPLPPDGSSLDNWSAGSAGIETGSEEPTSASRTAGGGAAGIEMVRTVAPRNLRPTSNARSATAATPEATGARLLPGERSYLRAIASLSANLEDNAAMSPALRAEYERNLAVVDQAIYATRAAAQSNPNDSDASRFLVTAYQNKIDLLQTISDQARFTAR